MFDIIGIIFPIFFLFVFGFILVQIIRGIGQWSKNNKSPILNVDATVVSKRTQVSGGGGAGDHHHHSSTSYYVTFQVASGDRLELLVPTAEYGFLVEEDKGELKFQGTRYLSFERICR
jgi:hypothetical protein